MTQHLHVYKSITMFLSVILSYVFGEWSPLITLLIAFVILDYISGLLAAACKGKLSSKVGFQGIVRKVMIFAVVAAAHLCDRILGSESIIMDASIYFYLANELLSIIENAGEMGLPVPDKIKKMVAVLKNQEKNKTDDPKQ